MTDKPIVDVQRTSQLAEPVTEVKEIKLFTVKVPVTGLFTYEKVRAYTHADAIKTAIGKAEGDFSNAYVSQKLFKMGIDGAARIHGLFDLFVNKDAIEATEEGHAQAQS